MEIPELKDFFLVGGTALSLLYGHRISIDLDLFSNVPFLTEDILSVLQKTFKENLVVRTSNPRIGVFCFINDVKVDIVKHPHPVIRPLVTIDNIRMISTEDIIAMKVQAILGRGKKKDFWDIAELLQHYSMTDFVQLHKEKYSTQNLLISVPQAITYFKDAEDSEEPVSLKGQTWTGVQALITQKVDEYLA